MSAAMLICSWCAHVRVCVCARARMQFWMYVEQNVICCNWYIILHVQLTQSCMTGTFFLILDSTSLGWNSYVCISDIYKTKGMTTATSNSECNTAMRRSIFLSILKQVATT